MVRRSPFRRLAPLAAIMAAACGHSSSPSPTAATDTGTAQSDADISAQIAGVQDKSGQSDKDEITAVDAATGYDAMSPADYGTPVAYHPPKWGAEAVAARAAAQAQSHALETIDEGGGANSDDSTPAPDTTPDAGSDSTTVAPQ